MNIIDRIFYIMEKNNIKSVELSNYLEINKSVISNWKSRGTNPPSEMIVKICELLKVTPYYLLTGKEDTNKLSDDDKLLLEKYNLLSDINKGRTQQFIDERLLEQQEQQGKVTREA